MNGCKNEIPSAIFENGTKKIFLKGSKIYKISFILLRVFALCSSPPYKFINTSKNSSNLRSFDGKTVRKLIMLNIKYCNCLNE